MNKTLSICAAIATSAILASCSTKKAEGTAPNNLKVTIGNAEKPVSLINSGYWGMGVKEGET